jgi:hypothetical protein
MPHTFGDDERVAAQDDRDVIREHEPRRDFVGEGAP